MQKQNEKSEVIRYKARLVIDIEETYSPMIDAIIFRYLISLAIHKKLDVCLMDVVTV